MLWPRVARATDLRNREDRAREGTKEEGKGGGEEERGPSVT